MPGFAVSPALSYGSAAAVPPIAATFAPAMARPIGGAVPVGSPAARSARSEQDVETTVEWYQNVAGFPLTPHEATVLCRDAGVLLYPSVEASGAYNRVEGLPVMFGPVVRTAGPNRLMLSGQAIWRTQPSESLDEELG